ncbi:hypothetical protein QVD17_10332 [Tagetes erecta]|uniref:Uncharacterized protein n=1 Tax=Tagetes erecta TaxID=13708 RepID=A0AAD8L7Q5_TARER|nr:hypothetical protein QVD17_10332 [Tagetes erecta]
MGTKLIRIHLQTLRIARTHTRAESRNLSNSPDLAAVLHQKLNTEFPIPTNNAASIYKVPDRLRSVEPKAYEPNIVSVGPYHHGAASLQAMEMTKWQCFRGIFDPTKPDRPDLNVVLKALEEIEQQARGCYSQHLKISSSQFINMMLIDSCFIIKLLQESMETDFSKKSLHIQRWMLPVLQRDLIMLENQLPMFVLNKVYDLTSGSICEATENIGLKELAVQYFEPMIYKDLDTPKNSGSCVEKEGGSHFLDLFRASICPTEVMQSKFPVKEPHMFRSVTELKESGVKLKKAERCQPLDVSFKKGVLKIAPVSMDDYRFTLFRNMVAFEQCHFACKPHVTAYVFFLDRLINSAEDIELLHYWGVMQHTLGGNKNAARLVNKLCKEVAGAGDDSYLREVLWKINCYCNNGLNQKRAKLKHEYFHNVWVSLSTLAAIVIIYFTVLQTILGLGAGEENEPSHLFGTQFWVSFAKAFAIPFGGIKASKKSSVSDIDKPPILEWLFDYRVFDDMTPLIFMSC